MKTKIFNQENRAFMILKHAVLFMGTKAFKVFIK